MLNIESIIEESAKIDRKAVKLFTKVILIFQYYICTSYSMSKNYYRGKEDRIKGIG